MIHLFSILITNEWGCIAMKNHIHDARTHIHIHDIIYRICLAGFIFHEIKKLILFKKAHPKADKEQQ